MPVPFPQPRLTTVGTRTVAEIAGTGDVPMHDPMTGETVFVSHELAKLYGDETKRLIRDAAARGDDQIGAVPLVLAPAALAVDAVKKAVAKKKAANDPTAPGNVASPSGGSKFDQYGNPIAVSGADMPPNSPFNVPGGYLGADDHVSGTPIGYDEEEVRCGDATQGDAELREDDNEIGNIEDWVDNLSGDVTGDDDAEIGALFDRDRMLRRRDERLEKRIRRARRHGRERRLQRLQRRRHRIERIRRRIHERRHRRALRRAERHYRHMMPIRDYSQALELIAELPIKGEIQRIPLLSGGNPALTLTATKTGASATTTVTATSAGISYASLRFLGLLVQVSAGLPGVTGSLAGPMSYRVTSAQNDGGVQVIYGPQVDVVVPQAVSSSTKGNGAVGSGIMWIPALRDKPLIRPLGTIKATIAATYHAAGQKTVSFATIEAICETVRDPQARIHRRIARDEAEGIRGEVGDVGEDDDYDDPENDDLEGQE